MSHIIYTSRFKLCYNRKIQPLDLFPALYWIRSVIGFLKFFLLLRRTKCTAKTAQNVVFMSVIYYLKLFVIGILQCVKSNSQPFLNVHLFFKCTKFD